MSPALRRAAGALLVVLFFTALTVVMTWPQSSDLRRTIAAHHDALFSVWRVAWVAHQLPRDPAHLFDGNIFHPEPRTLAFSDAMLVPALLGAPFLWLGVDRVLVYNGLLFAAFVLSGAGMFLLVKRLTGHAAAGLFAGVVFAFVPYRFEHYFHLELQWAVWMPLGLWALHRTLDTGRVRDGVLTGVFLALQMLSSLYYGVFFATYLAVFAGVLLIGTRAAWKKPRAMAGLALGMLLAGGLAYPYTVPYQQNRQAVGERPTDQIVEYSAVGSDYLAATPENVWYGRATRRFGGMERRLFPGLVVVILAGIALIPPLSPVRIAYLIGCVLAVEASFGFNGYLYEGLHAWVLPYRGFRVPARFSILAYVSLAVLGGFGLVRLSQWAGPSAAPGLAVLCIGLALLEYRPGVIHLQRMDPEPPPIYRFLRDGPPGVVLELPLPRMGSIGVAHDATYQYYSTYHWQRLVNGYSGFYPPSYIRLLQRMETFPDEESLTHLREIGIDYLVVHRDRFDAEWFIPESPDLDEVQALQRLAEFPGPGGPAEVFRIRD